MKLALGAEAIPPEEGDGGARDPLPRCAMAETIGAELIPLLSIGSAGGDNDPAL